MSHATQDRNRWKQKPQGPDCDDEEILSLEPPRRDTLRKSRLVRPESDSVAFSDGKESTSPQVNIENVGGDSSLSRNDTSNADASSRHSLPLPQAIQVQQEAQEQQPRISGGPIAVATSKLSCADFCRNRKRMAILVFVILAVLGGAIGGIIYGITSRKSSEESPGGTMRPTVSPSDTVASMPPSSAPTVLVLQQLGQTLHDPQSYTSTGPRGERMFGWAVDVSSDGKRIAASAPYCRCVFIYDLVDSSWENVAHVTFDAGVVDHIVLSGDGNVLVIGVPEPEDTSIGGIVQVFEDKGDGAWEKLGNPVFGVSPTDRIGGYFDPDNLARFDNFRPWYVVEDTLSRNSFDSSSLALSESGDVLAVGSCRGNYVRILRYDKDLAKWVRFGDKDLLFGEERTDNFGFSVDLSADGRRVIVGAPDNIGNALPHFEHYNGNVRVFQFVEAENTWVKIGQDIDGNRGSIYLGEHLGATVSISADGSTIAACANPIGSDDSQLAEIATDAVEGRTGYVKVYRYAEGRDEWIQQGNTVNIFHFGLAEHKGSIWLLSQALDTNKFTIVTRLSRDGNRLAVSVLSESLDDLTGRGLVRLYEHRGDVWDIVTDPVEGTNAYDHSGRSIALSYDGMTLAVGAPEHNGDGSDFGQVRVFELKGFAGSTPPTQTPSVSSTPAQPDAFISVALSLSAPITVGWHLECGGIPLSTVLSGTYSENTFLASFAVRDKADCRLLPYVDWIPDEPSGAISFNVYYGEDTSREDLLIVSGDVEESSDGVEVVFCATPDSASVTILLEMVKAFAHETGWSLRCGNALFAEVPPGYYGDSFQDYEPISINVTVPGIEKGSICQFSIYDTFGDGVDGFYIFYGTDVSESGMLLAAGGDFGTEETVTFKVSPSEDPITFTPTYAPSPPLNPTLHPTALASPSAPSPSVPITVQIQLDEYPEQHRWSLVCGVDLLVNVTTDANNTAFEVVSESVLVANGDICHFTFGRSLQCGYVYQVYYEDPDTNGRIIFLEGGGFLGEEETRDFTVTTSSLPAPATLESQTAAPAQGRPMVTLSIAIQNPCHVGWILKCDNDLVANVSIGGYQSVREDDSVLESAMVEDGVECQFVFEALEDSWDDSSYRVYYGDDATNDGDLLLAGATSYISSMNVISFVVSPDQKPLTPSPTYEEKYPTPAPSISPQPTLAPTMSPQPTTTNAPTAPFTIVVVMQMDQYPDEIGWSLRCNGVVVSNVDTGTYKMERELVREQLFVANGSQCTFVITDSNGDGICCGGFFQIFEKNGILIGQGDRSTFGSSQVVDFTVPSN